MILSIRVYMCMCVCIIFLHLILYENNGNLFLFFLLVCFTQISPKSDVWSLGCILYYMTYGKTPFQHIINQISKLHAIIDPNHEIEFPDIPEKDLQDVLKVTLIVQYRTIYYIQLTLKQLGGQACPSPCWSKMCISDFDLSNLNK